MLFKRPWQVCIETGKSCVFQGLGQEPPERAIHSYDDILVPEILLLMVKPFLLISLSLSCR